MACARGLGGAGLSIPPLGGNGGERRHCELCARISPGIVHTVNVNAWKGGYDRFYRHEDCCGGVRLEGRAIEAGFRLVCDQLLTREQQHVFVYAVVESEFENP